MPAREQKIFYRPELDALRFFAFFCVFFFHRMDYLPLSASQHPLLWSVYMSGCFGVPVFFLLSSFLIVELLLREREQTGDIHIRAFYVRRILRIWPLYFVAFYGISLLGHFIPNVGPKPGAWLAFTFFVGNWFILRHGWMAGAIDPLWSIAVEEQFYICVPTLAKWGGRRVLAIASVLLLAVAYIAVYYFARNHIGGEVAEWCNSWFQFQFFAAGALLAIVLHGRTPRWPVTLRLPVFLLAGGCWVFTVYALRVKSYYLPGEVLPGIGASLAGWGLVLAGAVLFLLATLGLPAEYVPRPLIYLGRISYGLYIFHSLLFYLLLDQGRPSLLRAMSAVGLSHSHLPVLGTVLVLAVTIALAALSYRYFEMPFLRLKQRFTYVRSRPDVADA
ncbi:MAG: acyltransferase family protein [Acidobacteriaceae bacterium]